MQVSMQRTSGDGNAERGRSLASRERKLENRQWGWGADEAGEKLFTVLFGKKCLLCTYSVLSQLN